MGLHKGKTNNPKGRPKGSQNKVTKETKELIKDLLDNNWVSFEKKLMNLDDKQFISTYIKLIEYVVPKQRAVEEKVSEEEWRYLMRLKEKDERLKNMTEEELEAELERLSKF